MWFYYTLQKRFINPLSTVMFDGIWVQTGTTHLILSKQSNVIVFGGLFFEVRNNSNSLITLTVLLLFVTKKRKRNKGKSKRWPYVKLCRGDTCDEISVLFYVNFAHSFIFISRFTLINCIVLYYTLVFPWEPGNSKYS